MCIRDRCGSSSSGSTAATSSKAGGAATKSAADTCAKGSLTLVTPGKFTIGTDDPAYEPWFKDGKPANGQGYESAVAFAAVSYTHLDVYKRQRHSRRARCSLLHESPGEARPSRRERILEVASELGEWLDSRGVEILGKSCASSVPQRHRTAALDHSLGQHLTDDNKRHPDTTTQRQSVAAFHVADALLQGTHARRRTRVVHDRRPFLTRCHSVVVISPCLLYTSRCV